MTKKDLYSFINVTINKKRTDETGKVNGYIDSVIVTALQAELEELTAVAMNVGEMADKYESFMNKNGLNGVWEYINPLRELRNFSEVKGRITRIARNEIYNAIFKDNTYEKFGLKGIVEQAKKRLLPSLLVLEQLDQLHEELKSVIRAAPSAKQAYKSLVALGVDMVDFENHTPQLPAIQKLSIDPCIINKGGCA